MRAKKSKPYWKMKAAELAKATKELDKEFVPTRPLTQGMKVRWMRAKKRMGRPRIGKGAQRVLVSLEKDLLRRADARARRLGLSRSKLIARGIELVLAGKAS